MKYRLGWGSEEERRTIVETTCPLVIVNDRGEDLYWLELGADGMSLEITAGMTCQMNDVILDDVIDIIPWARNVIGIRRPPYK